jgi:1-pyrroline-5-carboxylate dehydrogenase
MINASLQIPKPENEPVKEYAPGSEERDELKKQCKKMLGEKIEIPIVIGGEEISTGKFASCICPHDIGHQLGQYHVGGKEEVDRAAAAAAKAAPAWAAMPWEARLSIFRKAGDLLATKYRYVLNAATMLGQSKTAHQAEVDSACELIDFLRFNTYYAESKVYSEQPESQPGMWNYIDHRPLEGFVFAVTPFNFTAIAGNLPTAPAMMGNTVIWKPASSAVYSAHFLMKLFEEAGVPPGVINLVPGPGGQVGDPAIKHPDLAGVHFTGSTAVFHRMWGTIGTNIKNYKCYPRIVGETGGKDFIFAHPSADPEALITAIVRGAYEFQGQKCSAASRMYLPQSLHDQIKDRLVEQIRSIQMGDVMDYRNFMGAVIDKHAFDDIKGYIDYAKESDDCEILIGGECDDSRGYFISPTLIKTDNPKFKLMEEEIFGPVMTYTVYPDDKFEETLEVCDKTSPYALTGAVFSQCRASINLAMDKLRNAAGNFYINDKPTGAVVNPQPFGGARASGTHDKAGSVLNLVRWVSPRTVKETFVPPTDYRYPYMAKK